MPKTFDQGCYDLACSFLDDCKGVTEAKRVELASRIQQTIDDYGEELMEEDEAAYEKACEDKMDEVRIDGQLPMIKTFRLFDITGDSHEESQ